MIYRHSFILYKLTSFIMQYYGFKMKSNLVPTTDGAEVEVTDPQIGVDYKVSIERIRKPDVPDTVDVLLKRGGV